MPPATKPPLYLIDASLYVFRAWHSIPDDRYDAQGWPTNAVHGFTRFLLDLLEQERPQHVVIAFDEALGGCFRNHLFPAYKANREPAPPSLLRQFAHCKALCGALGLTVLTHAEYEADDLIGSALHNAHARGFRGIIVSADKDLSQLLDDEDEQWDFARNQRWLGTQVKARYGVEAHQIADYLALTGDPVDNIPGVSGIGAKTAAVLLAHFGSLDALLSRLDEVPFLRLRGAAQAATRLREQRDHALLWRQLTTVARDIPLDIADDYAHRTPDQALLAAIGDALRLGPLTRKRLQALTVPAAALQP